MESLDFLFFDFISLWGICLYVVKKEIILKEENTGMILLLIRLCFPCFAIDMWLEREKNLEDTCRNLYAKGKM